MVAPLEGSTEEQMRHFQEGVFLDVFGVRDPDFRDFNAKELTPTSISARRFYPYRREQAANYFQMAKDAGYRYGLAAIGEGAAAGEERFCGPRAMRLTD